MTTFIGKSAHRTIRWAALLIPVIAVLASLLQAADIKPAFADSGGYPWYNAPCVWNGSTTGSCTDYDWGESTCPSGDSYCNTSNEINGYYIYDQWGEGFRNCTSYSAWMLATTNGFTMPFHDYAKNWGTDAGTATYSPPAPGSIYWSNAGTYGHVAWVKSVSSDGTSVTIEDYNSDTTGDYSGPYTVSTSSATGYIHFKDLAAVTDVSGTDAVSWASGRIDVFSRGSDGQLVHTFYTSSGGWSPTWEHLGGGITGTPSAVSWQSGQLFVFMRGTDSHLYQRTYNSSTGWSGWVDLGGNIASGPAAVSWASGRIDIFARDSSGNLVHTFYTSSGGWSTWETLGNGIIDQPSAVSWQSGRLDVFAEGADKHLYQMTYTTTGGWTPWTYIGGTLASGPGTVSWGVNRIDVLVRGTATDLDHTFYDTSGWSSSWETLGGGIQGAPSAVSWQSGQFFAFMRGTDNHLYQQTYNASTGWSGWIDLGLGPW